MNELIATSFGEYVILGFFIILAIVIGIGLLLELIEMLGWLFDRITFGPRRRFNQQKRYVEKEVDYWRDLPFGGSIYMSNYELNSTLAIRPVMSATEAINAYILRLIYRGCLRIDQQGQLRVGEWIKDKNSTPSDAKHEKALYDLLFYASGADRILQEGEMAAFLKDRPQYLWPLLHLRHGNGTTFDNHRVKPFMPDAHLVGFRRYLKDFSLLGERRAVEVSLWHEYMVFATLFGIADQVQKDMQAMNPDFLKTDLVTSLMLQFRIQTSPYASMINERAAVAERSAPNRGNLAVEARLDYEQESQ